MLWFPIFISSIGYEYLPHFFLPLRNLSYMSSNLEKKKVEIYSPSLYSPWPLFHTLLCFGLIALHQHIIVYKQTLFQFFKILRHIFLWYPTLIWKKRHM